MTRQGKAGSAWHMWSRPMRHIAAAGVLVFGIGSTLPAIAQPLEQGIHVGQASKPAAKGASATTSAAANSVTQDGIALTLSDVKFNGEEVSVKLSQHAPKGAKEIADLTGLVNDETGPFSITYGFVAGSKSDVIVRFSHTGYDHRTKQDYHFPDKFEFKLQVQLDGMEKKPYEFRIPVSKNVAARTRAEEEWPHHDYESGSEAGQDHRSFPGQGQGAKRFLYYR